MNFAFGFTEVAALASICVTFGFGLKTGGPATLFWSFLVHFFFSVFIGYSLAELCAAFPSAGAVYHWSAQVSPKERAPLFSYITGWANFIGNAAGDATFATGWASFFSASIRASGANGLNAEEQVFLSIFVLWIWTCLNFYRVDQVGWVNNLAAVTHVFSILFICICCLSMSPRLSSPEFVFTRFYNDSGFESHSYVIAIGITSALYAFTG